MKTLLHAQIIISNLLVISSFLTVVACQSTGNENEPPANGSATSKSPLRGRNVIGSILLRAASLNSLNHQDEEHYATSSGHEEGEHDHDHDHDHDDDSSGQLSVPTDSGEDPLESSTEAASTATSANDDDGANSHLSQQQAPTSSSATVSDDDSGELDNNNVSAVIMSSSQQPAVVAQNTTARPPITCEQAYTQCALRKACAPALKAHNDHCQELIGNQTQVCSAKCLDAMIAMRSSEEGDDLANCDCQSNDYCVASKQRGQLCKAQVDHALDRKTVVSCSTASWICMSDQSCAPALGFYYRNCRSLLSQRHCSARCNNSLAVLHRQPKAHKLMSCQCDGSEDFPCLRLKTFTEQLCLNKVAPSSAASMFAGDQDHDQLTTEEESSNLTNNPENFVLGVPMAAAGVSSGGGGGDEDDDDDEDEDEDNRETAGEESSYNGIQLLEDNWIPLISGRYFTNLHQQQQQQQHLQTLGTHKPKQRHKQREQNQHKQQQARRVQRNMRQQRARSANATHQAAGKRSRFGRIFMFAASTSSAANNNSDARQLCLAWTLALVVAVVNNRLLAVNVY